MEGFEATIKSLKDFTPTFQKGALKETLKNAMKQVALPQAKRDAGTKWKNRSGKLKRSLTVRVAKARGNKRLPRDQVGFAVVSAKTKRTDAYWSKWVFFDRKSYPKAKGTRTLRRALFDNKRRLKTYTVGGLKAGIQRTAIKMLVKNQIKANKAARA